MKIKKRAKVKTKKTLKKAKKRKNSVKKRKKPAVKRKKPVLKRKKPVKKRVKTGYVVLFHMIFAPKTVGFEFKLLHDLPDNTYRIYSRVKGETDWSFERQSKSLDKAYEVLFKLTAGVSIVDGKYHHKVNLRRAA